MPEGQRVQWLKHDYDHQYENTNLNLCIIIIIPHLTRKEPKYCDYNNQNEDISSNKSINNKYSSHKFKMNIFIVFVILLFMYFLITNSFYFPYLN